MRSQEILAKVVFFGICTTNLQILRGLEPTVLGHEGVCQVLEVGKSAKGIGGEMIILSPDNPLMITLWTNAIISASRNI